MTIDAFLAEVRAVLGPTHVLTDADVVAGQTVDWTGRWRGSTPAVVRPGAVGEVVEILMAARRHRVALVPQGGNTGLVGGAVPRSGEVIVDLRRLDGLGPVDPAAGQVTVGAGVTLSSLQAHVAPHGLAFGVDLASRESATIGGMVATNAGGLHVVRYGSMRAQVVGIEAVLGTGARIDANPDGLLKDNTGYDLPGLLCGSEGTLGIVTAARLRLVPDPAAHLVALVGMASVADAVEALPALRALPHLHAVELMLAPGLRLVGDHLGQVPPLVPLPPVVLLVELAGEEGVLVEELAVALRMLGSDGRTTAIGRDAREGARLWRWRDAHPEAAADLGLVHKADVTIPGLAMSAFIGEVALVLARVAPGAAVLVYGHLADGNLHVNIVGPAADDPRPVDAVFDLVLHHGGSVSAEHGIGVAKRGWLVQQRGPAIVDAMRSIKAGLDPDGVLNPGVLLP